MKLVLRKGHEWRFEELEPGSIALDGAVQGPRLDPATRRYSFDHHAGCLRLLTSATCRQVFDAILMGLEPAGMNVHVNDLDGDTALSVWLLKHAARWRDPAFAKKVRPLVECAATVDAHGPAYPVEDPELARTFYEDVLGPMDRARAAGYPDGMEPPLDDALARLDAWWDEDFVPRGTARPRSMTAALDERRGWVLATLPPDSGTSMFPTAAELYARGHDRLLVASPSPEGWRYLVARRSDLVADFPLERFYPALNEREAAVRGEVIGPGKTWGGGSSVGGGPRLGSVLAPADVRDVIEAVLAGG